jgi:ketosteroid isomerase-like protein
MRPQHDVQETIIAIERTALDRWGRGDPQGYLELFAPDVTYFDPFQERRLDGIAEMTNLLLPITGQIKIDRYDMLNPLVQQYGEIAMLTFNLISYGKSPEDGEKVLARWNSTEAYKGIDGTWKIVHSHWSLTKPDLINPEAS